MKSLNLKLRIATSLFLLFIVLNSILYLNERYYVVVQAVTAFFGLTFIVLAVEVYRSNNPKNEK